jgi:benzoyl-CoA reductase/2-hydroxyglutaryl-CoA dehydratase subunit BcrC/BadD/HgdB
MGCFCSYVPEEILYAADILPVRMLGSHEPQDVTEPHIFGMFCGPLYRASGLPPTKDWPKRTRLPHILSLAKEWNVQGAIILQQKFCDPHELDMVAIHKFLRDNDIPTYQLELDVTVPLGPFRIRVEAFLEMLRQEDLF